MIRSRRLPLRTCALRLATVATGAAIALTSASPAHAAIGCQSTSVAQAASAGSCWRPFTANSPFNTPLGADPQLASDNAAVQQHMSQYGWTMGNGGSGFALALDGSRPVFYASPSDPTMTIHCTSSEGPGTCGAGVNGAQINVPAGAEPEANWDAHMTIIETATGQEYDLWHTVISGSTITAGTGAVSNVNSGDGTGGGGDAAGFSLTAGLLRPAELESGHIDHALVLVVPCTDATGAKVGYTWPAAGGWGEYCGQYWNEQASNAPELGQLVKLNMTVAQIASSGAPRWQQTVMTALSQYGAYIEDTDGSWHTQSIGILTEGSSSWTDLGQSDQWAAVARSFGQSGDNLSSNVSIPTSRLEMVDTCVTEGTCPSSSGQSTSPVSRVASLHRSRRSARRVARNRWTARRSHAIKRRRLADRHLAVHHHRRHALHHHRRHALHHHRRHG